MPSLQRSVPLSGMSLQVILLLHRWMKEASGNTSFLPCSAMTRAFAVPSPWHSRSRRPLPPRLIDPGEDRSARPSAGLVPDTNHDFMNTLLKTTALCATLASPGFAASEIVLADFEKSTYEPWTVTG